MTTMAASTMSRREEPEELRRKLDLLEGDRKAFEEAANQAMRENKALINQLRKENKEMTAKIKALKNPNIATSPEAAAESLRVKIHDTKTKTNAVRHQCTRAEQRLHDIEKRLRELAMEETTAISDADLQRLRTLENSLDKANIKTQEAQHVARTYTQIVKKLEQDRLSFDGVIGELEKAVEARQGELNNLELMYSDAVQARDHVKKQLSEKEQELSRARKKREAEKNMLASVAEDRRKQFEAMERRIKLASATVRAKVEDEGTDQESLSKLEQYEAAFRQIRDATGAVDMEEVVQRFLSQGESQAHLQHLHKENTEQLQALEKEREKLHKQFEALHYSGETQAAGNTRMLTGFEQHLKRTEEAVESARGDSDKLRRLLVDIAAGVDSLSDKLQRYAKEDDAEATRAAEKIDACILRIGRLLRTLETKKSELEIDDTSATVSDSAVTAGADVLPEHNTRVDLDLPSFKLGDTSARDSDSDSDDDEFMSRSALKKQATAFADAKAAKQRRRKVVD